MSEPIEEYLDGLYRRLRGEPRRARRILDEAADHLHAAADRLQADGMDRLDAEREAVRRFGSVDPLADSLRRTTVAALAAETLRTLVILGGIGLVAVGLSGGVAAVFNATLGSGFVGGASEHSVFGLALSGCSGALSRHVFDVGCSAGPLENSQDAVSLRVLAGLVGLVLLGITWLVNRRYGARTERASLLPRWLLDVLATSAFAVAAAVLIAVSVDMAVQTGSSGVGFYLSGAIIAALGAIGFGVRSVVALVRPAG